MLPVLKEAYEEVTEGCEAMTEGCSCDERTGVIAAGVAALAGLLCCFFYACCFKSKAPVKGYERLQKRWVGTKNVLVQLQSP